MDENRTIPQGGKHGAFRPAGELLIRTLYLGILNVKQLRSCNWGMVSQFNMPPAQEVRIRSKIKMDM